MSFQLPETTPNEGFVAKFDPVMANNALNSSPGNRNTRKSVVNRYANDMINNRWHVGNDAIVFDKNGRLRNGHHRLRAVVTAGVSVPFLVRTNVPEEEIFAIDSGLGRSLPDQSVFDPNIGPVTNLETSIVKAAITDGGRRSDVCLSRTAVAEAIKKYKEGLNFVLNECFEGRKAPFITTGPVLGVFLRAAVKPENRPKLRAAAKFLLDLDGQVGPGRESLKSLRDFLLKTASHGITRREIYSKTANMLDLYMTGIDRRSATEAKRDLFPIDEPEKLVPLNNLDPNFVAAIRKVCTDMKDGTVFTPSEMADKLIDYGFKTMTISDQSKFVAARFAKAVRQYGGGKLKIEGIGEISVYGSPDLKRVVKYRFTKHCPERSVLQQLAIFR